MPTREHAELQFCFETEGRAASLHLNAPSRSLFGFTRLKATYFKGLHLGKDQR